MTESGEGAASNAVRSAEAMLAAVARAESAVIDAIERVCAALRTGRRDEAQHLQLRLGDASRGYLEAIRMAQARLAAFERTAPDLRLRLEAQRSAFAALLKIELAVLAAVRAAAAFDGVPPLDAAA
ncbi:hypothetical protein ACUN0C_09485 [Faunimonas sp. B44]|uniref:hypothetical protein n=1 Tax=Faunimonas sp. B44 TaxID=3461493 RepID=UPI00404457D5